MKKLICATDVEDIIARGEKKIYVEPNTIFTPFAKDIIKNNNLETIVKKDNFKKMKDLNLENIDLNNLTEFLKIISKDDLLQVIIQKLINRDKNFEKETDSTGFTLIKGRSVNFEKLSKNILNQEIIKDEEKIIGLLKMENIDFLREVKCEEIAYIISGSLKIETISKSYIVTNGDILNFPKEQNIRLKIEEEVQLLYFSKESNWVEKFLDIKGG